MSDSLKPSSPPPTPRASLIAFSGMTGICLLGALGAGWGFQGGAGVPLFLAGALMFACPPQVRLPRLYLFVAALFLLAAAGALLPAEWFGVPEWRRDLAALGVPLPATVTPNPRMTAEYLALGALGIIGCLFLLSHRVEDRALPWLALSFTTATAIYAGAAIYAAHVQGPHAVFGFFPNRNHTACLLAMGTLLAAGLIWHGLRHQRGPLTLAAFTCLLVHLWALFGYNISRAGFLLPGAGLLLWWLGLGWRYFSRWALLGMGAALALVAWIWINSESQLKVRLSETTSQLQQVWQQEDDAANAEASPETATVTASPALTDTTFDLRVLIYRDVWEMLQAEPWTGVGLGHFRYIFPQYRRHSSTPALALHPESDWLWMLTEMGPLAVVAAAAGLLFTVWRTLTAGRGRLLWMVRMTCLAAALLVPLHGLFDVPGHRLPLLWAATLLAALAWRPGAALAPPGALCRWGFRMAGLATLLAGGWLVAAEWLHAPSLTLMRPEQNTQRARQLYQAELAATQAAKAAPAEPAPAPAAAATEAPSPEAAATATATEDEDPLYTAYELMEQAVALAPLDAYANYFLGALALYFDGLDDAAQQALARHRRLEPLRPETPLSQAGLLAYPQPHRVPPLWDEARRRLQHLALTRPAEEPRLTQLFCATLLQHMRHDPSLPPLALQHLRALPAGQQEPWLLRWAARAPAAALDTALPELLQDETRSPDWRQQCWKTWERRSRASARAWAAAHPHLLPQ